MHVCTNDDINFIVFNIIQGFDSNYHNSFKRGVEAYVTAEAHLAGVTIQSADTIREGKISVVADRDKQFFFEDNHTALMQPFTFAFLPYNDEEVGSLYMYVLSKGLMLETSALESLNTVAKLP